MRHVNRAMGAALAIFSIALGARALASQPDPTAAIAAQQTEAQVDVTACQACHGANGISPNPRTPNLAGQQPGYLAAQLQAFRSGTRRHELMQAVASQLSDGEINVLARYWSSRSATGGDHHAAASAAAIPSRMGFPANFPSGFTLYETVAAEGSVAERYANGVALDAARAGRPLPDGSVIVVVNRASAGGPPTGYAAMESRAGWGAAVPALLRNGNWDYAAFNAQGARNDRLNQAPCLACHRPQAANSFVFTLARLQQPASARH